MLTYYDEQNKTDWVSILELIVCWGFFSVVEIKNTPLGETRDHVEGESHPPFLHNLSEYQKMKRCNFGGLFGEGGWLTITKPISLPRQLTARPDSLAVWYVCVPVFLECGQKWGKPWGLGGPGRGGGQDARNLVPKSPLGNLPAECLQLTVWAGNKLLCEAPESSGFHSYSIQNYLSH